MRPKRSTAGKRRAFHDELSHGEYDMEMELVDVPSGRRTVIIATIPYGRIPMSIT